MCWIFTLLCQKYEKLKEVAGLKIRHCSMHFLTKDLSAKNLLLFTFNVSSSTQNIAFLCAANIRVHP